MKKRSLFAAVAMLIVSAIVLTSATYAWFAAATTATMSEFSATVQNTNGAIKISASPSSGFKSMLSITDVTTAQANAVASSLNPVSFRIANHAPAFIGGRVQSDNNSGTITNSFLTNTAVKGTDYTQFNIYVQASAAGTVTVTPHFTRGVGFAYAALFNSETSTVNNETVYTDSLEVLSETADSYNALITTLPSAASTMVDANGNDIIDDGDTGAATYIGTVAASTRVAVVGQTDSDGVLTLTFSEPGTKTITVCMWAEGQDPDCTGTVLEAQTNALDLAFAYAA